MRATGLFKRAINSTTYQSKTMRIKFTFTHPSPAPNSSFCNRLKSKNIIQGVLRQKKWNIVKTLGKTPAKAKTSNSTSK